MNRFWLYLRDVATSPQDFRIGTFKGGSAGSVSLLEPMLLSKFLSTVTVLVESARHSPHFLAVLAPEALELVLAIRGINTEDETVQTSMLQLALVVLDGSSSIDAGRTLAREHSKALWQLKDWAESVWAKTEGDQVGAEGRAAAGVLLRIDGVVQKTVGYI
jgi:telomere length regulation protein